MISCRSFLTVAPLVNVTFPNGGEALQRGLKYFIRWSANIAENVNIDLYKGGVFAKGVVTNITSNGAYQWQIGFDIAPGSDYTIKVSSTTNSALSEGAQQSPRIFQSISFGTWLPDRLIQ